MPRGPKLLVGLLMLGAWSGCLPRFEQPSRADGGAVGGAVGGADMAPVGNFVGIPSAPIFDATLDLHVNALVPTYSATSIVSVSAQLETLHLPMNHKSAALPAGAFSSCGNCHVNLDASGKGVYYPGNLHSSLANLKLTQPTSCADCHATSQPTGFVGPTATTPARSPASGEMKHDAVAWSNGSPNGTHLVTYDCGMCHGAPSQSLAATWASGPTGALPRMHDSIAAANQPQPSSCVDCHANSRPSAVLTSGTASLPAGLSFDHASAAAMNDCVACHTSSTTPFSSWSSGRFHASGSATPSTCVPCHQGERPTSTTNWASTSYKSSPFDYVTNAQGIGHGDGQDCVTCHNGPGTGAWGGTQNWTGGKFTHGSATVAGTTCIACHSTQRPDLQPGQSEQSAATLLGFDHTLNGTGDCFGCHQATVTAGSYLNYVNPGSGALPGGDWKGGVSYPGSQLIASSTQSVTVTESTLNRSGPHNLVTSMSSIAATLYNSMLHTSTAVPAALAPANSADIAKCQKCHGSSGSYANGHFHTTLTANSLQQPSSQCSDCHVNMRPSGIVERAASELRPMDHGAQFTATVTIGGTSVSSVSGIDCSVCHKSPGTTWADGQFHSNIGAAQPKDCTVCHYPLMADGAASDLSSGTNYAMKHRSVQLTFQNCQNCHGAALGNATSTPAATLFKSGALQASVSAQPTACVDCHTVSEPAAKAATRSSVAYTLAAGGTASNAQQWMNHGASYVAGVDCVSCHAQDAKASGSAWSKSDSFHAVVPTPSTCQECHGLTNGGGATPGTNNNMPAGLTNSSTVTTAANDATTGVASGTLDQISHLDVNVTGHDCNFCHLQIGVSTAAGVAGKEWAQARFHQSFGATNPLVINGTSGRCSNCHLNVKPGASFSALDHSAFTNAPGSKDCSSCHSWPGTGTASAPNWLGSSGVPTYINVGGFTIAAPPAVAATTQVGISNLPHPTASGTACTACHTSAAGGKPAIGYDHASTLINTNCSSCHEAGSDLVGTPWNGATAEASGAGDTRPFTLGSITAHYGGNALHASYANHFYPVDCYQCHVAPSGIATTTTGAAYAPATGAAVGSGAWNFPHNQRLMTNPTTCVMCHTNGVP
jgi:hypothetical protein